MRTLIRKTLCLLLAAISFHTFANPCASNTDNTSGYQLKWSSSSLGSGLGASGLHSFDSNNNGINEVIFGTGSGFGGNTSFAIAEYNNEAEDFVIICQSAHYDDGIIVISEFSNETIDAGSLIALSSGIIEVIDHKLGFKAQRIQTPFSTINDLAVGDIDNDGTLEIIALSNNEIAIYDANSYAFEQSLNYGGSKFSLGHFSQQNKIQIALNTGYVLELSEETLTTVWDYSTSGFSNYHLEAGDIDNDGLDEIVAADSWYNMRIFNADTQGFLWEHNADLDIDAVDVYDVTGDGIPEVVYGDGQWGSVYALNGSNGELLWTVNNPEHGTTDVFVGNIDDDVGLELVWGAGHSSSGADYLYVHDIDSDTRQWQSPDSSGGNFAAVAFGRLNSDQVPDRIFASYSSQSGDGILTAVDGSTDEVLWQTTSSTFGGHAWTGIHDVTIGDIDGDNLNEVLVGTDRLYDGRVYILNGANGEVASEVALESGSPIYSVMIADMDGDGDMEILAGGGKEHTGANGVYVYVIDGTTLSLTNTFPNLGNTWNDIWNIALVDIDKDNTKEVIALLDKAFIIDPDNNGLNSTLDSFSSITTSTDVFTGEPIVYLGNTQGELVILAADATTTTLDSLCNESITALTEITPVKLAFTCNGALGTYDIVGNVVFWITKDNFDANLGMNDRIAIETVNGKSQIFVGGKKAYLFELTEASSSDQPEATNSSFSGHFNKTVNGTLLASDPNNAILSYGIYQQPSHGTVDLNAETGEFTYTPSGSLSGNVEFQFYVSNGNSASNLAIATVELTNSTPVGENSEHEFHWQGINIFDLNAADADEDVLQFEIVQSPSVGVLTLLDSTTGAVSYVNNSPSANNTFFLYRISDGGDYSETYQVNIQFTNTLPTAPATSFETFVHIPLSTLLIGLDGDEDSLTYQLVGDVTTGQVTLSETGLLTYTAEQTTSHTAVISYRVFDGRTWSSTGAVTLLVHEGDVANYSPIYLNNFSADKYAGIKELTVNFSSALTGGSGNYTYLWDLGDDNSSTAQNPQHAYAATGIYEVKLLVKDIEDETNQAFGYLQIMVLEEPINFSPLVIEAFNASEYAGIEIHDVDFTLSVSGGSESYNYQWDFGDGNISTEQNPSHSFLSAGEYTVRLTATDQDDNENAATGELKILVLSEPQELSINLSSEISSEDELNVIFTVDIEGKDTSYLLEIDFGDGNTESVTISENTYAFNHSYADVGSYSVDVKATSQTSVGVKKLTVASKLLKVERTKINPPDPSNSNSSSGGSSSLISLLMLCLLCFYRREQN